MMQDALTCGAVMMCSDRGMDGRLKLHHEQRTIVVLSCLPTFNASYLSITHEASGNAAKHSASYIFFRLLDFECMRTVSPWMAWLFMRIQNPSWIILFCSDHDKKGFRTISCLNDDDHLIYATVAVAGRDRRTERLKAER